MAGKYAMMLGCLVCAIFVVGACWVQELCQGASQALRHVPAGPMSPGEIVPIASGLGLHWSGCPSDSWPYNHVIVSDQPLTTDRLDRLNVHHPDFERWRGIVSISPCAGQVLQSNFDPAHSERYAVWGRLFVYGDPELIAKLMPKGS